MPDAAAAVRQSLAAALAEHIAEQGWTQATAAAVFGTSQSRVSALVAGKAERFSIDCLVTWLSRAGREVKLDLAA